MVDTTGVSLVGTLAWAFPAAAVVPGGQACCCLDCSLLASISVLTQHPLILLAADSLPSPLLCGKQRVDMHRPAKMRLNLKTLHP